MVCTAGLAHQIDVAVTWKLDADIPSSCGTPRALNAVKPKLGPNEAKLGARLTEYLPALLKRRRAGEFFFKSDEHELCIEETAKRPVYSQSSGNGEFVVPEMLQTKPGGETYEHDDEALILLMSRCDHEGRGGG